MFKVVVAGGRDFNNLELLENEVIKYLDSTGFEPNQVEIISGGARGADQAGEWLAELYGLKLTIMRADWGRYGRSAGYRRNEQMAEVADAVICFWDGQSRGTKHMIDIARRQGLPVTVITY